MGKFSDYKKLTSSECHYCDYTYKCRKGHKCNWYKAYVKKWRKKKNDKSN